MSNMKRALENAREGIFDPHTDVLALLEMSGAKFEDPELTEHNKYHGMHPDGACKYCWEKVDAPEEVEMEVQDV
jgi:hypothetical protein